MNADVRPILETIRVPTLVLHRTGNRYIRVGNGRYLAEHIPRARLVELPGDDHFFYAGDVEAMLAPLEEFLTGARPVAGAPSQLATACFIRYATSRAIAGLFLRNRTKATSC